MQMIPKIGSINFLNADPLCKELGSVENRWEIIESLPSELAAALRKGDLDIALVPQVEACLKPSYRIIPGFCISCDGAVGSILLFGDQPWEEIRRVAVDRASNSSLALLSVLRHLDGLPPLEIEEGPSDLSKLKGPNPADAVLLIGDAALRYAKKDLQQYDLGSMWKSRTGLPFVFAVWLANSDLPEWVISSIKNSALRGLSRRREWAEHFCRQHSGVLDVEQALHYLEYNIRYELGDSQIEALVYFHKLRCELDSSLDTSWVPKFFDLKGQSS